MTPEEKKQYNKEYYERNKKLKGRSGGRSESSGGPRSTVSATVKVSGKAPSLASTPGKAKVARLESKVKTLEGALSRAKAELSKRRQNAVKEEKKNSDGKSSAEEKRASKEYRDKNKTKLAAERKKSSSSSSSGGGTSTTSSSKSVSSMSVEELESRIIKIQSALKDAKRQLSNAKQQHGQLAHSAIISEPTINDRFARFRSAERTPSNDSNASGLQWLRHTK